MNRGKFSLLFLVVMLVLALPLVGYSEDNYPDHPITIIIPFSPGGSSDIAIRAIEPFLSKELGLKIVIENRPGANSQIGATEFMRRPDDGYTFFQCNQPHISWTILTQDPQYKIEDFYGINAFHITPSLIAVLPDSPYNSIEDLIEDAKARPGEVKFGVTSGGPQHILPLWLGKELDIDWIIIPYDGGAESKAALYGGHSDVTCLDPASIVREGFKPLVLAAEEKSILLPDLPLLGPVVEKYGGSMSDKPVTDSWRGLVAHATFKEKYPNRWKIFVDAYERAFHNPDHMAKIVELGMQEISNFQSPEATQEDLLKIHNDLTKYKDLLLGIQ